MLACFDNKSVDNSQYNKDARMMHMPSPNWMTLFSSSAGKVEKPQPIERFPDFCVHFQCFSVSRPCNNNLSILSPPSHHTMPITLGLPNKKKQKNIMSRLKLVQS